VLTTKGVLIAHRRYALVEHAAAGAEAIGVGLASTWNLYT
jgi:hypothetical protein